MDVTVRLERSRDFLFVLPRTPSKGRDSDVRSRNINLRGLLFSVIN